MTPPATCYRLSTQSRPLSDVRLSFRSPDREAGGDQVTPLRPSGPESAGVRVASDGRHVWPTPQQMRRAAGGAPAAKAAALGEGDGPGAAAERAASPLRGCGT